MPITLARTLRRRTRVPGPIQRQVAALAPGRSRSPVLRSSWNTAPFDTLLRSASQLPFDMLRARLRMLDCGDSWRSFVVRAEALTRAGASCRLFEAMSHPLEQLVTVSFEGLQDSMLSFVLSLAKAGSSAVAEGAFQDADGQGVQPPSPQPLPSREGSTELRVRGQTSERCRRAACPIPTVLAWGQIDSTGLDLQIGV